MKRKTGNTLAGEFEKSVTRLNGEKHVLILYVAGMTSKSTLAIDNVKKFCEHNLQGRYELKVVDLYQQPQLAKGDQIIATPTLIKTLPLPLRKLIGDMSDTQRILVGMDIKPAGPPPPLNNLREVFKTPWLSTSFWLIISRNNPCKHQSFIAPTAA